MMVRELQKKKKKVGGREYFPTARSDNRTWNQTSLSKGLFKTFYVYPVEYFGEGKCELLFWQYYSNSQGESTKAVVFDTCMLFGLL